MKKLHSVHDVHYTLRVNGMGKSLLHHLESFMRITLLLLVCTFANAGNSQSIPAEPTAPPAAAPTQIQVPPASASNQATGVTVNNTNTPIVNVYNSNQGGNFNPTVSASAKSLSESYASAKSSVKNRIDVLQSACMSMIPESISNNVPPVLIHLRTHLKWYLAGTGYMSICTALVAGNHYINSDRRWARWKKDLSMIDFYAQTHKQIAHDLIHEIQRRYLNQKNPTDFLTPLITFLREIDYEISRVNWYIRLATLISWCRLTIIFPINEAKLEQARHAQERLRFIKHVFISWAGEYNIGQAMG